ncbi:hypothetical protein H5410_020236 [Solanum commersonii]|uniref:Cytochrome P450 n=1 Tax=Solanum commersonii TaxID=4109 RepID=A0A9J5Z7F7_SOLCO|nr:hypothetical protein H5410_020236 [Solanum commersonii]
MGVILLDYIKHAIFSLLEFMCFGEKLDDVIAIRKEVESVFIPLIEARIKYKVERENSEVHQEEEEKTSSYVDTLLNLELTDEKRKLTNEEIISLCGEFLGAANDTTSTAL